MADAALAAAQRVQQAHEASPSTSGCPAAVSRDAYAAVAMAAAAGDAAAVAFLNEVTAVPAWVQWDRVAEGQQFFLRNLVGRAPPSCVADVVPCSRTELVICVLFCQQSRRRGSMRTPVYTAESSREH